MYISVKRNAKKFPNKTVVIYSTNFVLFITLTTYMSANDYNL